MGQKLGTPSSQKFLRLRSWSAPHRNYITEFNKSKSEPSVGPLGASTWLSLRDVKTDPSSPKLLLSALPTRQQPP